MGYNDSLYNNASLADLEYVGDIEWDGESYEFNMTAVWKGGRGKYYIADDSGCSCPMPFEDITKIDQLDGPMLKRDLESALRYRIKQHASEDGSSGYRYGRSRAELEKDVRDLLSRLT